MASQNKVDKLFEAFFALVDIRQIFRETAPKHDFDKKQKDQIKKSISKAKNLLDEIQKGI